MIIYLKFEIIFHILKLILNNTAESIYTII